MRTAHPVVGQTESDRALVSGNLVTFSGQSVVAVRGTYSLHARFFGGGSSLTRTSHLANFLLQTHGTAATSHQPRHVILLALHVIELKNHTILFAALHTCGIREDLQNECVIASIRSGAKRG
jgi:hypothetical protein